VRGTASSLNYYEFDWLTQPLGCRSER